MPAPSTSTLALRGRAESTGRVPAGPAIKFHEESAVITSDEPPTAPRWPRNRRRVSAERERDERGVVMLNSRSPTEGSGVVLYLNVLHAASRMFSRQVASARMFLRYATVKLSTPMAK